MMWPMWPALPVAPVQQLAVQHDPALDGRRHHHRQEVLPALRRAQPAFGERERLRTEVAVDVETGRRGEVGPQRERPPRADVGRRHSDDVGTHRAGAADADRDRSGVVMRPRSLELRLSDRVERGEQRVGLEPEVDVDIVAVEQLALHRHQSGRQLGVADVERQI